MSTWDLRGTRARLEKTRMAHVSPQNSFVAIYCTRHDAEQAFSLAFGPAKATNFDMSFCANGREFLDALQFLKTYCFHGVVR